MLDTGLPHRIRAKGVEVVLVAGWETRSAGSYEPAGSVNHHTAGASRGATPSLATVIYGRPDVRGPLCHVLQSREPDPSRDKAYVIAAGRANHAGAGGWKGLSGNSRVGGLEVEHVGTGTVPPARLEISARIQAALLEAPSSPRRADLCCQHVEWAPDRKIDFRSLAPWNPALFRARVAYWIGRSADEEDDDMALFKSLDEFDRRVRAAVQAELTTGGDQSRTALYDLVRRAVADQSAYWGRCDGELALILFNAVRVPVGPAAKRWADQLRAASNQPAVGVVDVPAAAWDDMAVLSADEA